MTKKKGRKKKILLISLLVVITGGLLLNWFLAHQLQGFLREKMSEKLSEATNGFYTLKFDHLSIGIFNGELKIEGLEILPDSAKLEEYTAKDSLPDTYFNIRLESINFKGLNLTWRRDYRKLHFDLFEIKTPTLAFYSPYGIKTQNKSEARDSVPINLYEMIAPFFDVVSVKRINLENASISHIVANVPIPSTYALKDVTFKAYGFLLDKDSYKSGKLLFCNNFEFISNKKQTLLENSQFVLNTDKIELRTQDSIIHIRGIEFIPQKELWAKFRQWPAYYLAAKVDTVNVEGIYFEQINFKSYLNVRLFNISSSDIEYVGVDSLAREQKYTASSSNDTLGQTWSLYNIISPVFSSVAINKIELNNAQFKYTQIKEEGKDEYTLNDFDFYAREFKVDSASTIDSRLLYSESFGFNAQNIKVQLQTLNHLLTIKDIGLNTTEKTFYVKGVAVSPIETQAQYDYINGSIDSLYVSGLNISDGLGADTLYIKTPDIRYTRNSLVGKKQGNKKNEAEETVAEAGPLEKAPPTILKLVAAITSKYSVGNIKIDDANFAYAYRDKGRNGMLKIEGLNAFASDFLIDQNTRNNIAWYFDCTNFGFNLKSFNNYILDQNYRLMAQDIVFSGIGGNLQIRNLKLLPQSDKWTKSPGEYFKVETPLFFAKGIHLKEKIIGIQSLRIDSPEIDVYRDNEFDNAKASGSKEGNNSSQFITGLKIGDINIGKSQFSLTDKTKQTDLKAFLNSLKVSGIDIDLASQKNIRIDNITLEAPNVTYTANAQTEGGEKTEKKNLGIDNLDINTLTISNPLVHTIMPDKDIRVGLKKIQLNKLKWKTRSQSFFGLQNIDLHSPTVDIAIHQTLEDATESKPIFKPDEIKISEETIEESLYETFGTFSDVVNIENFSLYNANIDYKYSNNLLTLDTKQLHNIDFSLKGFEVNSIKRKMELGSASLSTRDLSFPINNGFYTIYIDSVRLGYPDQTLSVNNLKMESLYPKLEFAYKEPRHKDWFGLDLGSFIVKGIDISGYFNNGILKVKDIEANNILLQNYKNQNIEIQHNIMPMIYSVIQKAPIKFEVENLNVNNFAVTYEELSKGAEVPGKIFFTDMNGHLKNFTNVASYPHQFNTLNADGKLMGTGHFTATWQIPVDTAYNRFILQAKMEKFDLLDMNQLIYPMAKAKVSSGMLNSFGFDMDASSLGGHIGMLFLYNDLKVSLMSEHDGEVSRNDLVSSVANAVIRRNNPNKASKRPRFSNIYVERDPYHSTFNYFWQILQPAIVESVGISQKQQNFIKGIPQIPSKLKNFFWSAKKPKTMTEKENNKE